MQGSRALSFEVDTLPDVGVERPVTLDEDWLRPLLSDQFRTLGGGADVVAFVMPIGDSVEAHGTVSARVGFSCSRCGDDGELEIATDWSELFLLHGAVEDEDGGELSADDAGVAYVVGGVADVEPTVAEALVLATPSYPLCHEGCKGCCPTCGANLNRESCRCSVEVVDPRWQKLAALRDKLPPSHDSSEEDAG